MSQKRVSSVAYRLWKYLESLARCGGWISVKIATLMRKYNRKESTVKGWFSELYRSGILASKRRGQHPPVYTILIPTIHTSEQTHLFTEHEEHEKSALQHPQTVAVLPKRADDVALPHEVELKTLAGLPGKRISTGDRNFLLGLQACGVQSEAIRGGICLGMARKMVQRANTGRDEPPRSLRYFAGAIREAATLPATYLQHAEQFIRRHRTA